MRIPFPTKLGRRALSYPSYLKTMTWCNNEALNTKLSEAEWEKISLAYGDVMAAIVRRYERFLWRRGEVRELLTADKTDRRFFYVTAYDVYPGTVKGNLRNLQAMASDFTLDSYTKGGTQYFTLCYDGHREMVNTMTRLYRDRQSLNKPLDFLGAPTQTELVLAAISRWWYARIAK